MATITARAAATTVMTRRVLSARRRPRHSAHAAKHAAAVAECPLGNDMPDACTRRATLGRGRPTTALTTLLASPMPTTVTARNTIAPRARVRSTSMIATTAVMTITTGVLPRSVNLRRKSVLVLVACRPAHRATSRSAWATKDWRRTWNASTRTATSIASATVSARPVALAGLRRLRTKRATLRWRTSCVCTASAVAWTGPWDALLASRFTTLNAMAASAAATTPAKTNTSRTDIAPPIRTRHCSCSRGVAPAIATTAREEDIG